jgi:hypothetical protein
MPQAMTCLLTMGYTMIIGPDKILSGNVDPIVLYGSESSIRNAVNNCISQAKGKHILNLGNYSDTHYHYLTDHTMSARTWSGEGHE